MSFSRLLRFFSNPFSITSSNSSAPEKEESSSNSSETKKEESSSNSSAPKIMVSTSTSSIALLGVMLMASSTFIYYLYSRASSSNSSEPKKEESSSNSSEPKNEESSSNSSAPKIMASTSTSSIQNSFKHDVFLSFRGEDTRKNFVGHLYQALKQKGIETYKDDEKIEKGERINDQLLKSIEESRFYIIVFSKTYASSSWCLDELVKIIECQKTAEQTAYPVFFDVEPTQIRKQSGAVEVAFAQHEKKNAAGKWREALKEASNLAGWELKATANGDESKLIQMIVDDIFIKKNSTLSNADGKLVGMETRINDVLSSLEIGTEDVRMIGIKGIGGGGKTTLARAIYDHISKHFEGKAFVENVREVSNLSGLKKLQKRILKDVLNKEHVMVSSVHDGKNMLKANLCCRKILLVLDDVDCIKQLDSIAGEPDWFKSGSRIIITTRDEQVLKAHGVSMNFVHDVNLLSHEESICLFNRYAFRKEIPFRGYEDLSGQVVQYANGLPLTIKVLGSFLCGKDKLIWVDAIERLKKFPLKETLKKLELSYTGLDDDYKEIFLDITCIFKGQTKEDAIKILESCGFHARNGLKVLEQRSLITVDEYGFLGMHDHIEEMGKNIVRRSHPEEPNKHSRLWIREEIEDILANNKGTKATKCLKFYMSRGNVRNLMKGLGKMKELRYLELHLVRDFDSERDDACLGSDLRFVDTNQCFTNSLKYLKCTNYPFLYLPKTFQANNLVRLEMVSSRRMIQLWEEGEKKVLKKLKYLSLHGSNLTTFEFRITPNLESLYLQYSCKLKELCMPDTCHKLKHLDISYSELRSFDLGLTPNLETLSLESSCKLEKLCMPVSCQKLKHLNISLSKLRTFDLGLTPNIEWFSLYNCADFEELHVSAACPNLKFLNLSKSSLKSLDLELIPNLESLDLVNCKKLVEINAPVGCMKKVDFLDLGGSLMGFTNFAFYRKEPKINCSSATLIRARKSLDLCPLHPNTNLRVLLFHCYYDGHLPSSAGNIEKLLSFGLCACTDFKKFSDMIYSLRCLNKLKFECSIPEFPKDLGQLECLEELCLSSTQITHLPDSICMLKRLKVLEVINCDLLEKLPEDLDQLECLEKLHVRRSKKIEYLSDSICMLKRLISLHVTNCCLGKLPEDIGQLESLERLDLSATMIKHLPDSICMLKHLNYLNLEDCALLEKLPEDIGQLKSMERLDLSKTKIKHLPDSICMLKHLKYLNLLRCAFLEKLPEDLGRLECLEELDIANTGISHLPQSIFGLKRLYIEASSKLLQKYENHFFSVTKWASTWKVKVVTNNG